MFTIKKMFKQSLRDEYTLPKIRNNYKGEEVQQVYIPPNLAPIPASPHVAKEKIQELKAKQDELDKKMIAALNAPVAPVGSDDDDDEDLIERESVAHLANISEEEERVAKEVALMKEALKECEEEERERDRIRAAGLHQHTRQQGSEVDEEDRTPQASIDSQTPAEDNVKIAAIQAESNKAELEEKEKAEAAAMALALAEATADQIARNEAAEKEKAEAEQTLKAAAAEKAKAAAEAEAEEKVRLEAEEAAKIVRALEEESAEAARIAALPRERRVVATPATVIKTRNSADDGKKVFINVLVHPDVAPNSFGVGDSMKEGDGYLVCDVCCNESDHDIKLEQMEDDPDIMIDVSNLSDKNFHNS